MAQLTGKTKVQPDDDAAPASSALSASGNGDVPVMREVPVDDAVVRRTKDGWRVGDADLPDLTSAMVLADLISAELAAPDPVPTEAAAEQGGAAAVGVAAASATSGGPGSTSRSASASATSDP